MLFDVPLHPSTCTRILTLSTFLYDLSYDVLLVFIFSMSLFAAGCAERNLNPIETGKRIWIPDLMNGCGSCVLSGHSEMEKKKSLRQMSDLNVHVADNHKAEKRILSNDLTSDFFSEVNGLGFWLALHPKYYLRLIVPNSWRRDAAVRARTEMMGSIRVNQLSKRRMKEIEQGWGAASSPSLTTRRNLCQIAVRSLRIKAKEPESTPSLDLTSPVITSKRPLVWRVGWSVSISAADSRGGSKSPKSPVIHDEVRNPLHDHVASS